MEENHADSVANIQRHYRYLFTLPARNRTVAYASIPALAATVTARITLKSDVVSLLISLLFTEIVLIGTIKLESLVLRPKKVSTFRRLASLAIISNAFWFVLTVAGFFDYLLTHSEMKFVSLAILGAFFAISFRALVIGSIFYDRSWKAIPLALVQPLLLILTAILSPQVFSAGFFLSGPDPSVAIIGGLITLLGIEVYMAVINNVRVSNLRPFELLQAFLSAWAAEDATNFERVLNLTSREGPVRSQTLSILPSNKKRAMMIVPGVHPGPFYPIGSSTLPSDIFSRLNSSEIVPLVVHSISDHDLNLPSKKQVERYVASLQTENQIESGSKMSEPMLKTVNKTTVIGLAFGLTLLIAITQAPHGGEDLPTRVQTAVESYATNSGFKNALIIDSHNSEGVKPGEKEADDAITAARLAIDALRVSPQFHFKAGVAHSSEVGVHPERDIGPAGIGLILFELDKGTKFSLVTVDANNSVIGFREKMLRMFEGEMSSKILEIFTSDTHITAAKTSDAKGYLALGDRTSVENFTSALKSLYKLAEERMENASFSSASVTSSVRTIGSDVLDSFSGLFDSTSAVAKNGARVLGIIALVIAVIVAFV